MEKGENPGYQHFLLLSLQCFRKASFFFFWLKGVRICHCIVEGLVADDCKNIHGFQLINPLPDDKF